MAQKRKSDSDGSNRPARPPKKRNNIAYSKNTLWASVLILSGIIFLLNNFGALPWSIWGFLWRFWPVFLILGGVQIVFGNSSYKRVLVVQIGLMFIIFILLVSVAAQVPTLSNWFAGHFPGVQLENITRFSDNTQEKEITLEENKFQRVTSREINLHLPGGEMHVIDSANSYYLKLNANYYRGLGEPNISSGFEKGIVNINFDTDPNVRLPLGPLSKINYDFDLGQPIIDTDLSVDVGAGKAAIDLERMTLNKFSLNMGAGTADVIVKGNAVPSGGMDVKVGAGSVYINIPADVAVKINHDVGIGTLRYNRTDVTGKGTFQPVNTVPVTRTLEMNIEIGAGVVNIETD